MLSFTVKFHGSWTVSGCTKREGGEKKYDYSQRTVRHKDKRHSCIPKHVETFIRGTPEPHAAGLTKTATDKDNFIKS